MTPRTDSLIAVDLATGKLKWWQQLIAGNQWAYDVSQPPLVYQGKVGGKTHDVVSVATMEGVWFAFDAKTGQPVPRAREGDRPRRAPAAPSGRARDRLPVLARRPELLARFVRPGHQLRVQRRCRDGRRPVQQKLTPTQKRRKLLLGDVYLGLQNGNFGAALAGWHDHGSISAIDVSSGKRVWKFPTPEPERGGVTTTASGLGFAGGGDGVLRAFDLETGKVLWTFKTGNPIASGPTIFAAGGKEYVAVTVGGTPTSSNGGTVSQLFVFTLGTGTTARATQSVQPRGGLARDWRRAHCPPHARRQPVAAFGSPSAAAPSRSRSGEPTARTKPPSRGASVCEASLSLAPSSRSTATGCPGGPTPRVASPCSSTRRSPVGTQSMSRPPPMQPWAGAR